MGWKDLFRCLALGLSILSGTLGAIVLTSDLYKGMDAPMIRLGLPVWIDIPLMVLALAAGATLGFMVPWIPYWVIVTLCEAARRRGGK